MTLQEDLETALWSILPYAEEHASRVRGVAQVSYGKWEVANEVEDTISRARKVLNRCYEPHEVEVSSTAPSEWDRLLDDELGPPA
jgi:hypothetical protein